MTAAEGARGAVVGGRFALFADCLLVGLLTAAAAAPVVTAYPALTAACAVLRARVRQDRAVTLRGYGRCLLATVRSGPGGLLLPPLAVAVLALDAIAVAAGVPGSRPLGVGLAVAALLGTAVGLRAAACWRTGQRWRGVLRVAARDTVRDPGGSALLALSGIAAVAIAVVVPVTVLLLAGPLALAAIAVQGRVDARD